MRVTLTEEELAKVFGPVTGQGGWQDLFRAIQSTVDGNTVVITAVQLETMQRWDKGQGGWQDRVHAILAAIDRAGGFKD